jgi:hypothetical protein
MPARPPGRLRCNIARERALDESAFRIPSANSGDIAGAGLAVSAAWPLAFPLGL